MVCWCQISSRSSDPTLAAIFISGPDMGQSQGYHFPELLSVLWQRPQWAVIFCLQYLNVPTCFYLDGWDQAITTPPSLSRSRAACLRKRTLPCMLSESSISSSFVAFLLFMLGALSHVQTLSDRILGLCFHMLQNAVSPQRIVWLFAYQQRWQE